jgi:diguanylate cyclase (GGDEF)-like protein
VLNSTLQLAPFAPWLALLAFALAAGFGRNRAALLAMVLATIGFAQTSGAAVPTGYGLALRLLIPAFLLIVVIAPEPPLVSRRVLALAAMLVGGLFYFGGSELRAQQLVAVLGRSLAWPTGLGLGAMFSALAALISLLRWISRGLPIDFGLTLTLALLCTAFMPSTGAANAAGLMGAAAILLVASVLYSAFRMAFVDQLTGLANRRSLDERLNREAGRLGVAMVDVDHFKKFNDRHGHDAGDVVLKAVASQLRRTPHASAYRYGGEEFTLIFTGSNCERAADILEDLRERIANMRVDLSGKGEKNKPKSQAVRKGSQSGEVRVTISIGSATRGANRRHPEEIIKAADQALYKAKQQGRNRVQIAPA